MIVQTFVKIAGQIVTALYKTRLFSPLEYLDCKQHGAFTTYLHYFNIDGALYTNPNKAWTII